MWKETLQWVSDNAGLVFAATVIILCFGSIIGYATYDRRASIKAYWEHRRTIRIQRGLLMGKRKKTERQAYLKQMLADVITHGFEEAWFAGKVTVEEKNAIYRAIGKTHNIPDLVPIMTNAQLKSAIKGRKAHGGGVTAGPAQENPAWGARNDPPAPPVVPDPANGSNVVQAARRFGAKALNKLKKTA